MKWFVYILFSEKDKRTYVGSTNNLDRRIKEHNSGNVTATKYRIPFKLLHSEKYESEQEARNREKYYKASSGRRYLKKLFIANQWGVAKR